MLYPRKNVVDVVVVVGTIVPRGEGTERTLINGNMGRTKKKILVSSRFFGNIETPFKEEEEEEEN